MRNQQKVQWADKLDTVMQPREYIAFAAERIADAAVRAWHARKPGGISFGLSHAVAETRLPPTGWRFAADPEGVGRDRHWYRPDWNDGDWRDDVPIETSWQNHLEQPYHGAAWYRREIELPELPPWNRAYLIFEGVDEQAWVWVNGRFVGDHKMGPSGWNVPFRLDVTDALTQDTVNQIAVKAANTAKAGGIWQPLVLHFFR